MTRNFINIKGALMDLSTPQVMGILNITPDSFYAGSRNQTAQEISERANRILEEGAGIIDIGGLLLSSECRKHFSRRGDAAFTHGTGDSE